jgi:D-tyrosyl-tRNA(Tyr) deacylase
MRLVIQRVKYASVSVEQKEVGKIDQGLLVLLGIENEDSKEDVVWLVKKLINLRIFNDINGVMNESLLDQNLEILLISQFTLFASTKKGNRPSYIRSAKPDIAIPMYESFKNSLSSQVQKPIQTGIFGADMKVELLNDGPVTIIIDSKQRE